MSDAKNRPWIWLGANVLFAVALATVVSHTRLRTGLLDLSVPQLNFIGGIVLAHAVATAFFLWRAGQEGPRAIHVCLAVALAYGGLSVGLLLIGLSVPTRMGFLAGALGTTAFLSLGLLAKWRGGASLAIAGVVAAVAAVTIPGGECDADVAPPVAQREAEAEPAPVLTAADLAESFLGSGTQERDIPTAFYPVRLTIQEGMVPAVATGGGMAAINGGLLVVSADGQAYMVATGDPSGRLVRSRALAPPVPTNRAGFERFVRSRPLTGAVTPDSINEREFRNFRVLDVLVSEANGQARVLVSHHYWQDEGQCFVIRVSQADVPVRDLRTGRSPLLWRTVFDSTPCLGLGGRVNFEQSGGRMIALAQDEVLLAIGDHGVSGGSLVQDRQTQYGKTVLIDLRTGAAGHFTVGHRNPQGLLRSSAGRIWETEHGPQGGDELNLLTRGDNYGWPIVTYGTGYGKDEWPDSPDQGRQTGFAAPVFAWVPSIGVSQLIELRRELFELWRGDLLVASLTAATLFRVRLEGDAIRYAEPVFIGRRVRDIEELPDGRIILLLDDGSLGQIQRIARTSAEIATIPALFQSCRECHLVGGGKDHRAGPDLWNIVGRDIASAQGFVYSDALQRVQGVWTREALHRFLRDPAAFAPGTTMSQTSSRYSSEIASLVDYLATLR